MFSEVGLTEKFPLFCVTVVLCNYLLLYFHTSVAQMALFYSDYYAYDTILEINW